MKLYLIRHAQSAGNVNKDLHKTIADHNIPLTEEGQIQAFKTGEILHNIFSESPYYLNLYSSPYLRTRQTTSKLIEGLGETIKYQLNKYDKIKEHFLLAEQQYGLFDGVPDEDIPKLYPNEHTHYQKQMDQQGRFWARMPLGESRFDVAVRCNQFLQSLKDDKTYIIISHSITIRALAMNALDESPEWFDKQDKNKPKNCSIRLIDNKKDLGYIFDGYD